MATAAGGLDVSEPKKYNILENVLQKINQKYIALPDEETRRNNKVLQVIIDNIIQKIRSKSPLFNTLYQTKFYGGSFYDGLKVGKPTEYDIDCILCLPKIVEPTIQVSDKPGYVHVVLNNLKALQKKPDEAPKYVGLEKNLLEGDYLSTKKVKPWMESLVSSVVVGNTVVEVDMDDGSKCNLKYKLSKGGPAVTIKMEGNHGGNVFNIDIDLVPCFTFFNDQWPKSGYRPNPSKNKNTFFVVPKSPSEDHPNYWRLSFQEQERELIGDCSVMKPTIRLIKKIRDRYSHKIASYYIKTVFLWELERTDRQLWNKSLSFVFAMMLRKYSEYVEKRNIPYYWNESNNLIGDLTEVTCANISNKIRNIADHIEKICNTKTDIYGIVPYLLSAEEVDIETFKQEVPLTKKLLKQVEATISPPKIKAASPDRIKSGSSASSPHSSFEDISKDAIDSPPLASMMSKVEGLCLSLATEQKRILELLEVAVGRIESCERQITDLRVDLDKQRLEELIRGQKLERMIERVDQKLEEKKGTPSVDDILGLSQRSSPASDFQRL